MGYLGSTYTTFDPTRTIATPRDADRFTGDGSTTTFTLSRTVDSPTDVEVFVENVQQEPLVAYTITGTSLIFTEAPKAPFTSTTNIYVIYRAFNSNITVTLPDGVVTSSKLATNIRLFTVDNFTANGSATSFALSDTPASANTLIVAVNGVLQTTPNNFTVSGSTLTFTSAPAANANVTIRHLGYRSTTTLTAIPANTTITQPTLSNPIITLAGSTSYKANVDFYDSTGTTLVGNVSTYSSNSMAITANTTLDFRTNNTTRMLVDSSGRLGIGITSPTSNLHVIGANISAMANSVITSGTSVASTSGTAILFTGIPSWVKRVTVLFNVVSTSGSNYWLVQIGAGSVISSGYNSTTSVTGTATGATTSTSGFILYVGNPSSTSTGKIQLELITGNTWICTHILGNPLSTGYSVQGGGVLALSGALDRVNITTVGGTDTFDAGSINILYE